MVRLEYQLFLPLEGPCPSALGRRVVSRPLPEFLLGSVLLWRFWVLFEAQFISSLGGPPLAASAFLHKVNMQERQARGPSPFTLSLESECVTSPAARGCFNT